MTRVRNKWNGVAHDLDIDENGRVVRPLFVVSDGRDRETFHGYLTGAPPYVPTPEEQAVLDDIDAADQASAAHNRLGSPAAASVDPSHPTTQKLEPAHATRPAEAAAGDIPPRYVFVPGNWSDIRH